MQILGLNTLDLLLLVILFIGVLVGFVRGALMQIVSLVSIWLGLVASLWLYRTLSANILKCPDNCIMDNNPVGADTLAFIILLIVFFNAFRLIVRYLVKPPEERKKKKKSKEDPLADAAPSATQRFLVGPFQAIGGMIMGFILTTMWIALVLGILQFLFQPTPTYTPSGGLVTNINGSSLVPIFNFVLRGLVQSVDLFVPENADILRKALEFLTTT